MNAFMAVVVNRSNSRNWGDTDDGRGHEAARVLLAHDGRGPFLVGRIDPGEQKAHCDGLHAFVPEPAGSDAAPLPRRAG